MTAAPPVVEVLGIRHHGPGSARAVLAALAELRPDTVLIEGPPEADALVELAGSEAMRPPVALLAHAVDDPRIAAFWPFAVFSPEWQALRWATGHGVPVRFCDLPAANVLAGRADAAETPASAEPGSPGVAVREDPLALLADAAGYDDPERWWDDVIESRQDGPAPFPAITEAMAELRATTPPLPPGPQLREDRREAHMRTVLRAVLAGGARRVAVVCGAWHAPALTGQLPSATADAKVLRGRPKRKVSCTWVPWTHARLATASGYGAGVASPGWYHHLFTATDRTIVRWLTRVAGLLRAEDLPVSSAHVIEATRLAQTLATLRGRPLAGLAEVTEATRAVLCDGDEVALALVSDRLVVGEELGAVPAETPTVPLEADLRATARRLKLRIEPLERTVALDLRGRTDAERSRLLHRLRLLGIGWGVPAPDQARATGTFRETWTLRWDPELALALIEASTWGTTVESAATAKLVAGAAKTSATLPDLTAAVEAALRADLPDALGDLLAALDARAALDLDLAHLMEALPALARALRYGDVRGTDTAALARVTEALGVRICAGLPAAVTGLDDDAARETCRLLDAVHGAFALADERTGRDRWLDTLAGIADRPGVHGLLAGRVVRRLRDAGKLDGQESTVRLAAALSVGTPAAAKAAWVEGLLDGGGLLLAHDADLLALLDGWVATIEPGDFVDVLPLLRRTFGSFAAGERTTIATRVRRGPGAASTGGSGPGAPAGSDLDDDQATPAVRAVAGLLGVPR